MINLIDHISLSSSCVHVHACVCMCMSRHLNLAGGQKKRPVPLVFSFFEACGYLIWVYFALFSFVLNSSRCLKGQVSLEVTVGIWFTENRQLNHTGCWLPAHLPHPCSLQVVFLQREMNNFLQKIFQKPTHLSPKQRSITHNQLVLYKKSPAQLLFVL